MPHRSGPEHRRRYVPPNTATLQQQLAEIKIVLEATRLLPVAEPLKKSMLKHALWEVAIATGNTQNKFLGRYRSESVKCQEGLNIRRDHIYQERMLLKELLGPSPDLERLIARAQLCCVVTKDEHDRLSHGEIDGGERYRIAGIAVYDMLHERKVVPEVEWPT